MHPHGEFFHVHALHPVLLLLGLACFPRITMLFVGGPFSILQWVGWAIAPHLTVAIMATCLYWDTNPVLVVVAWLFAFGGTSSEAKVSTSTARRRKRRHRRDEE